VLVARVRNSNSNMGGKNKGAYIFIVRKEMRFLQFL
jgi:hypothetical protein